MELLVYIWKIAMAIGVIVVCFLSIGALIRQVADRPRKREGFARFIGDIVVLWLVFSGLYLIYGSFMTAFKIFSENLIL